MFGTGRCVAPRVSGRLSVSCVIATLVAVMAAAAWPAASPAATGKPVIESFTFRQIIPGDEFFLDMCGVTTDTTWKEQDTLKTWPDGSQTFHTERSFIPADPRLPIERGAGTSYFHSSDPASLYRIDGKPIQLIAQRGGGVTALDAGLTILGDPLVHHGHLSVGPSDDPEYLRTFYCPWATP